MEFNIVAREYEKWQISNRRAKWNDNRDLRAVLLHIWGTFGFGRVAFKVILREFGAVGIYEKVRFSKRCCFYTYDSFTTKRFIRFINQTFYNSSLRLPTQK